MKQQGNEGGAASYDLIEYPSYAYAITHPDNLATIATLFGLSPQPVTRCRVLELGCGRGGNIIPMAFNLPESQFVGLDIGPVQINDGNKLIEDLGLSNIELSNVDICDVGPEFGEFDYIICHGVYSWVSQKARDQVLRICRKNLATEGVACVSYNIYPGWNEAEMLRNILQRTSDSGLTRPDRVAQARHLLETLCAASLIYDDTRAKFLEAELKRWRAFPDGYIYFEFLEGENHPVTFTDFLKHAQRHHLQYLGNGRHATMELDNQPPNIARMLKGCTNVIEAQQYLDFLSNRRFRTTLLCDEENAVDRNFHPERLFDLNIRADVEPAPEQGGSDVDGPATFTTFDGIEATVKGAANRCALSVLKEVYPEAIPFEVLVEKVLTRLGNVVEGKPVTEVKTDLATALNHLFFANVVHLHSYQPDLTRQLDHRPKASQLSRSQAKRDAYVATQWHRTRFLEPASQTVLKLLDGRTSRDDLTKKLCETADNGPEPRIDDDGQGQHSTTLELILESFRRDGLLVPDSE